MNLSKSEELLMGYLWMLKQAFLKDLLDSYPKPKPALTTISTLLKRMQGKGFVSYTLYGNSRQYFPVISKQNYFVKHLNGMIKHHFEDSALQFASFFTSHSRLTKEELEELKKIVNLEIKAKK